MVPVVRLLYLAFCVQGGSTKGVDAKVFYWTRKETSWNLCGRSRNSNLKTSHYLKIIPIHWPLEKTKWNLHTGRTGINMKQTHSGKRWQAIETDETSIPPKKRNLDPWANFCGTMFFSWLWHHSRQHKCDRSSSHCRSVEAMTLPKLPSLMLGVGLWWRAAGWRKTLESKKWGLMCYFWFFCGAGTHMYLFLAQGGRRSLMGHLANYLANPKL